MNRATNKSRLGLLSLENREVPAGLGLTGTGPVFTAEPIELPAGAHYGTIRVLSSPVQLESPASGLRKGQADTPVRTGTDIQSAGSNEQPTVFDNGIDSNYVSVRVGRDTPATQIEY